MKLKDIEPGHWYRVEKGTNFIIEAIIYIPKDAVVDKIEKNIASSVQRSKNGKQAMTWTKQPKVPAKIDKFCDPHHHLRRLLYSANDFAIDLRSRKLDSSHHQTYVDDGYAIRSAIVKERIGTTTNEVLAWLNERHEEVLERNREDEERKRVAKETHKLQEQARERLPEALVDAVRTENWMRLEEVLRYGLETK